MTIPEPSRPPSGATTPALTLTGERTLPGIPDERYWFERHVVAYQVAVDHLAPAGTTVLDAGCGEGYGLAMLADAGAARVIGVDLEPAVVAHAAATYAAVDPRIEVIEAELGALPLADAEVALTVSFQVIEHLHDIPAYLASLRRVTRPGGRILIATPNRLTFTPDSDTPVNPFHTREFTAEELRSELVAAGLEVTGFLGVHHGSGLRAVEDAHGTSFPDLITATPPEEWSAELRRVVHAVRADGFEVRADHLDDSLDLLAICTVPDDGHTGPDDGHTEPDDGHTGPDDGHTEPDDGHTEPDDGHTGPDDGVRP